MIQRNCLECTSCGTAITTRFGVGHGTKQIHIFACRVCGVPITCTMHLDHSKPGLGCASFDEPVNGRWIDPKTKAPYFVTFHAEVLAPREAFQMDGMSPFVASVHYFRDYPTYQVHELMRKRVREEFWESVKRAAVHFERRQWDLFAVEVKYILDEELKPTFKGRVQQMSEIIGYSVQWFVFRYSGQWKGEANQFARAIIAHPAVLHQFAEAYRKSGRFAQMWRQLLTLHDDFVTKYPSWMPILQLRYWKVQPTAEQLADLVVSDKRFDELKMIYLNAFELLGRISTIALAVELIAMTGSTNVPTKKGKMSIWEFEEQPNASKANHLGKYVPTKHFVRLLDSKLRNGIGHAAAHYDAATDEVVCFESDGSSLKEWRISYTGFCEAMVDVVSNLFFAEQYLFDLMGLSRDLLPSRKKPSKPAKVQVVPSAPVHAARTSNSTPRI
jgi:hypothetical protein